MYTVYDYLQPDLAKASQKLNMKICLLCLMEMTFNRPSNNRRITFEEIAKETRLKIDEVSSAVIEILSI